MADFQKTMLRVGRYQSPDGEVVITPRRLKHWENQHKRLTAAKQVVPMHWDHGDDVDSLRPLSNAEYKSRQSRSAKNTVGRMIGFRTLPGGRSAEVTFRTSDPIARNKVQANDVYVSPVIFPKWQDSTGNQLSDVITHLDLVNHPVDHSQGPAEPAMVRCALRLGLSSKPLRLALEIPVDEDEKDEDKLLMDVDGDGDLDDAMGEGADDDGGLDMPDIGDENEGMDDELGDESMEGLDAIDDEEMGLDTEPDMDIDDLAPGIGDLMLALADHGIILPEDTQDGNFLDRLRTALIATKGDSPAGNPGSPFDDGDTIVADPQIATMSVEGKYAAKQYQKQLNQQLRKLLNSGRCSPAEFRQKQAQMKVQRLSLSRATGKAKSNALTVWLKSRASLPVGAVWSSRQKLRRMSLVAVEQPKSTKVKQQNSQRLDSRQVKTLADEILNS